MEKKLYVPELDADIVLSVGLLAKSGYKIVFEIHGLKVIICILYPTIGKLMKNGH